MRILMRMREHEERGWNLPATFWDDEEYSTDAAERFLIQFCLIRPRTVSDGQLPDSTALYATYDLAATFALYATYHLARDLYATHVGTAVHEYLRRPSNLYHVDPGRCDEWLSYSRYHFGPAPQRLHGLNTLEMLVEPLGVCSNGPACVLCWAGVNEEEDGACAQPGIYKDSKILYDQDLTFAIHNWLYPTDCKEDWQTLMRKFLEMRSAHLLDLETVLWQPHKVTEDCATIFHGTWVRFQMLLHFVCLSFRAEQMMSCGKGFTKLPTCTMFEESEEPGHPEHSVKLQNMFAETSTEYSPRYFWPGSEKSKHTGNPPQHGVIYPHDNVYTIAFFSYLVR